MRSSTKFLQGLMQAMSSNQRGGREAMPDSKEKKGRARPAATESHSRHAIWATVAKDETLIRKQGLNSVSYTTYSVVVNTSRHRYCICYICWSACETTGYERAKRRTVHKNQQVRLRLTHSIPQTTSSPPSSHEHSCFLYSACFSLSLSFSCHNEILLLSPRYRHCAGSLW